MKTNFLKMAVAFVLGFAIMVACNPEENAGVVGDGFPKLIDRQDLLAGDTLSITFTPKHDWEISLPYENIQWFWLAVEGEDLKNDYLSGSASKKPMTVYVVLNPTEEYNASRSVEVTMTMNGKTQTIAKLTRPAKVRSIKVFTAKIDNQGFVYSSGGDLQFKYGDTPAEEFALVWPEPTASCMMRVLLQTNVEWKMTYPDWLEYKGISEDVYGIRGNYEFRFEVQPSKHPLDGADELIIISADDDSDYHITIGVSAPPAKEKMFVDIYNYVVQPLSYNAAGQCKLTWGFDEESTIVGSMLSTRGAKTLVAQYSPDGYYLPETAWVTVQLADWYEADGADVIQDRNIDLIVDPNEGEARKALIFFLPESLADKSLTELLNQDMKTVREEYADYAYELSQAAAPTGNEPSLEVSGKLASVSAEFKGWGEEALASRFEVPASDCYKMTYGLTWGSDEANVRITKPWTSCEVYDSDFNKVTIYDRDGDHTDLRDQKDKPFWMTLQFIRSQFAIHVDQDQTEASEGYVKVLGENDSAIALIWFVFDPEFAPSASVTVEFIGDSAQYAEMAGASLAEITSGEYFESYKDYGCPIYRLTYQNLMSNMPMTVSLPSYTSSKTVPDSKKDRFAADATAGGATIKMGDGVADTAVIIFYSGEEQPCFVLVCEYTPKA